MNEPKHGQIGWIDLTVPRAVELRDFYAKVVGWKSQPVPMGDYDDFCMVPAGGDTPVAGICHARGDNADVPPQWLVYITVADLDQSVKDCEALGGTIIIPIREMGGGRFAVMRDPAGAVSALFQAP